MVLLVMLGVLLILALLVGGFAFAADAQIEGLAAQIEAGAAEW